MTLDLFSLRSVFWNATESDSQQNPGIQVQSYLSTSGFGAIFFPFPPSLSFAGTETKDCAGHKPLLIRKMIFSVHQSIHDFRRVERRRRRGRGSSKSETNKLTCLHIAVEGRQPTVAAARQLPSLAAISAAILQMQ